MKKKIRVRPGDYAVVLLSVTILALLAAVSIQTFSASAAPPPFLLNPGFEEEFEPYEGVGELTVGIGWSPWYNPDRSFKRPEYQPEKVGIGKGRVYIGTYGQKYFATYGKMDAGIYQIITDVSPGDWYEFSCMVYIWSSQKDNPDLSEVPGKLAGMVGINPWGDANMWNRTTVWGKESVGLDGRLAYNTWIRVRVVAEAWSNSMVVATRGNAEYPVKHNDIYWDACSLVKVSPPGVPGPSPTPEPCPTCEPGTGGDCPSLAEIKDLIDYREPVKWPQ